MLGSRQKLLWISVAVAAAFAVYSVIDGRGFRRYFKLQRDLVSLEARNQKLRQDNRARLREIQALRSDPKALERASREELGFIRPGEVVINLE